MKRLFTMLLAVALLCSLAACGGGSGAGTPPPTASQGETTMTPEQTPEAPDTDLPSQTEDQDTVPETAGPSDTQTPDSPAPQVTAPPDQSAGDTSTQTPTQTQAPVTQTPVIAPPAVSTPPAASEPASDTPKILIAYFTWADNTEVEDPSSVDVDATTSASVLAPGNAAKMASWIQQEVGGDLHSIVVEDPYSSDYDECLDRAADEKADNARPALTSHVDNFEDYDVVFLGFPNWWYDLPMPVLTFVEEYDWSGKIVAPFVTHGTGGLASTIRTLTSALPEDVTILDSIGVYRPEVDASRSQVETWAAGLDLGL